MKNSTQITQLSNLSIQTVLAVEGVRFATLAQALPGVLEASYSISDVPFIGDDSDDEIDIKEALPLSVDIEERMVVMDKFVVVGGLGRDDDNESPLDAWDGQGVICHRNDRRGDADQTEKFYASFGYDSEGEKLVDDETVEDELANTIWASIENNAGLIMDIARLMARYSVSGSVRNGLSTAIRNGGDYASVVEAFTETSVQSGILDDEDEPLVKSIVSLLESKKEQAWEAVVERGELGNPLAVSLSIYEHSGIMYSVTSHDPERACAAWIPDADAIDNIKSRALELMGVGRIQWFGSSGSTTDPLNAKFSVDNGQSWNGSYPTWAGAVSALLAEGKVSPNEFLFKQKVVAEEYCKGVLESYNAWLNGEVYGTLVYVIDRESGDVIDTHTSEVWGFYGSSEAESELEGQLLSLVASLGTEQAVH